MSVVSCNEQKDTKSAAGGKKGGAKVLSVEGYVVKQEPFQSNYTTSGSLLPYEEVKIMPEIQGRITSISFKEGGVVHKGQVLASLYNADIKAQIQKLKAQRELQVKTIDRQAQLLKVGGISQQDYDATSTQISAIDADIAYAQAQLTKTTIVAPFSGRTGIRNISTGAIVSPGTVITTLQQTGNLKMDFSIPEQYRDEVKTGKEVSFTVSGSLDTFVSTVIAIEPSANAATRTLKVRAEIDNKKNLLGSGAFAHVIVPFTNNKNAMLVPSQSVIPTNREKVVAVVKNGITKMVPVIIGARTSDRVEIISGLSEGDTILTTGIMQVKEGMKVSVTIPK